jgi:uncharacterized membrane protein YcaP (DUF421 family)
MYSVKPVSKKIFRGVMVINSEILAKLDQYKKEEIRLLKKANLFSNLRLASFILGAAVAATMFYNRQNRLDFIILLLVIAIFLYFVERHQKVKEKLKRTRCYISINENVIVHGLHPG